MFTRKRVVDYILTGKKAALDDIEDYCRAELLTNKKDCRHITGFLMELARCWRISSA